MTVFLLIFTVIICIITIFLFIIHRKKLLILTRQNERLLIIASIINHDLRGSIENIEFASTELTRMINDEDFDILEEVEEILRISSLQQIQRLNSVVSLMKDIKHQQNIQKTSCNLLNALDNLIEREGYIEKIILDKSLNINIKLNLELFDVIADNLIKNAIVHNDSLEKIIKIYINDNHLIFEDNARKFPISNFEYLKQFNTKGANSNGNGQGLYIITSAISILGWKLEIENIKTGNKFKIKIKHNY